MSFFCFFFASFILGLTGTIFSLVDGTLGAEESNDVYVSKLGLSLGRGIPLLDMRNREVY